MIIAAADATSAAVNWPVILLSALGGALLTALFALLGAWLSSRREHAAWVREKRYDAFAAAVELLMQMKFVRLAAARGGSVPSDAAQTPSSAGRLAHENTNDRVAAVMAPLGVLGPDSIQAAIEDVTRAIVSGSPTEIQRAEALFVDKARSALGIKD
ncbi:hypothetical protein [Microbacterium natoriense]